VAGRFASIQGDYLAAQSYLSRSLDLFRELGDREGMSLALSRLGIDFTRHRTGDPTQAREALEEALAIAREIGNSEGISNALGYLGTFTLEFGDPEGARVLFEEGLSIARQAQNMGQIGSFLLSLGDIARMEEDFASARATYEECIPLFEATDATMGSTFALLNLTYISLREGDLTGADRLLAESLTLLQQSGHRGALLQWIGASAIFHLLKGDLPRAIGLFSATQAAMDRKETVLEKADHLEVEQRLAEARALASEDVWSSAWEHGQSLSLEQAVVYAQEE
jgi:tetratricopeptide (TPR) repeat protein